MADQRAGGISWTEETWNPTRGCRRVNPDCINCYAERLAATRLAETPAYKGLARLTPDGPRWTGEAAFDEARLREPLGWQRPRMVFVDAMSDLFYEGFSDEQIDAVVAVMALAARHTFQVLTKRPARMAAYLADRARSIAPLQLQARRLGYTFDYLGHNLQPWPLPNVWWGASMGHRQAVLDLGPHLLRCRDHAAVLWASCEPLTEDLPVELILPHLASPAEEGSVVTGVDWVVGGGESGPEARPCPIGAARHLRDACSEAGIPFHWKQWGEWIAGTYKSTFEQQVVLDGEGGRYRLHDFGGGEFAARVGKKRAGRLLDGVLHDAFPRIGGAA